MPTPRPLHERIAPARVLWWMKTRQRSRLHPATPWAKIFGYIDDPHALRGLPKLRQWLAKQLNLKNVPLPESGVHDFPLNGKWILFTTGVGRKREQTAREVARARPGARFIGGQRQARQAALEQLALDALEAVAKPPLLGRGRKAFLAEGTVSFDEALARGAAQRVAREEATGSQTGRELMETVVSRALEAYENALETKKREAEARVEGARRREIRRLIPAPPSQAGRPAPAYQADRLATDQTRPAPNGKKRRPRANPAAPAPPVLRREPLALGPRHFYKPYEEYLERTRDHRPRFVLQVVDQQSPTNQFIRRVLDLALPKPVAANIGLRRKYAWGVVKVLLTAGRVNRNVHVRKKYFVDKSGGTRIPGGYMADVVEQLIREGLIVESHGHSDGYEFNYDHPIMRTVQG